MFERFGIMDLFVGFWKNKYKIILFAILATVLFYSVWASMNYVKRHAGQRNNTYSYSATFYFDSDNSSFKVDQDIIMGITTPQQYATTFDGMLDADFCKLYIREYLLENCQYPRFHSDKSSIYLFQASRQDRRQ